MMEYCFNMNFAVTAEQNVSMNINLSFLFALRIGCKIELSVALQR